MFKSSQSDKIQVLTFGQEKEKVLFDHVVRHRQVTVHDEHKGLDGNYFD